MPFAGYQPSFIGGVIGPSLYARIDWAKYLSGCKTLDNMLPLPQGGVSKRPGFKFIYEIGEDARLVPFVFNETQAYVLLFANYKLYVAYADGLVTGTNGQPVMFSTPYSLAQAKALTYAQCADVMYLAHGDVHPHKLRRYAHNNWLVEQVDFSPPPAPTQQLNVDFSFVGGEDRRWIDWGYIYTYVDADGNESLPGGEHFSHNPTLKNNDEYVRIMIPAASGASEYRLYKMYCGTYGYLGSVLPENIGKKFIDDNITPDTTQTPPRDTEYFIGAGNYPTQVAFYQQRMVFAASYSQPQTVWMSRAGSFENFTKSLPVRDDDCIEITIASNEVSMPLWMVTLRSLVLGTGSGVWEIASRSEVFTPTNLSATPQNYRGCAPVRPVVIGSRILYVMQGGRQVYELAYSFGDDAYADNDVSILASSLFEGKRVTSMVYQAAPHSMVWLTMSDGSLLSLTFLKEQQVSAWASHNTQGAFSNLCVLPGNSQEIIYAMVRRNNRWFLEKMTEIFETQDIADAFFVDSGASYSGGPATNISGLGHLNGLSVNILADGVALPAQPVINGAITLAKAAGKVHVGLGYSAELETLPWQAMEGMGSTMGMKKRINAVDIMFHKTVGCKIAGNNEDPTETPWRTIEAYDTPILPRTITLHHYNASGWQDGATMRFISDKPLPMTILAIAPQITVNAR